MFSDCRVKPRRVSHATPNMHISVPRKKERKLCRGKKSAKFWATLLATLLGSTLLGSTLLAPTFSRFGPPTLRGLHPSGASQFGAPPSALSQSGIGLKRCWPEQVDLKRFGLNRSLPEGEGLTSGRGSQGGGQGEGGKGVFNPRRPLQRETLPSPRGRPHLPPPPRLRPSSPPPSPGGRPLPSSREGDLLPPPQEGDPLSPLCREGSESERERGGGGGGDLKGGDPVAWTFSSGCGFKKKRILGPIIIIIIMIIVNIIIIIINPWPDNHNYNYNYNYNYTYPLVRESADLKFFF